VKQKTVLLVDDDRFVREAVGEFLHEQGYQVRLALDGLEALQAVRADPPDFLVLDLVMPKVDGGRLCRYLREDSLLRHIPIIVFSALAARDIVGMQEVSADAYVAKGPLPIVTKNLLAALEVKYVSIPNTGVSSGTYWGQRLSNVGLNGILFGFRISF
jgi:CheY-like chemotaxis protein